MTLLGEYLAKKSIKKAEVSRKTGLSQSRLSELTLNKSSKLRVDELYLIALAIDTNPCEVMNEICKNLTLKNN
ncbi:helix-turn-helix transcriptional regulator [Muricauda oceani]|uniref:Helix-turn-helix transcriptional regulator n=1 Tax=Flagellimonas oceani TaxID=2698672 RepID=A0A6G7IZM2_9FLAO|nr:helix-turn-helix transcriptional regulator [Allomuricauda oceani]MBW8244840.1 helix-turn-helix transcriptional regulator [Allomuricauda oceani]QII43850.1 helix-turn-helix transcriptional regulator [Allomuricauda oceani]